jgi:tRNA G37 N-methylase Trm5
MKEENQNEKNIEIIEDANTVKDAALKMPIFPMIISKRLGNTLSLETVLRKKYRGKWYLWEFNRRAYVKEGTQDQSAAITGFMRDIYMAMLYGKVDTKVTYKDGGKVFKLDENQMDEKLRMRPLDWSK